MKTGEERFGTVAEDFGCRSWNRPGQLGRTGRRAAKARDSKGGWRGNKTWTVLRTPELLVGVGGVGEGEEEETRKQVFRREPQKGCAMPNSFRRERSPLLPSVPSPRGSEREEGESAPSSLLTGVLKIEGFNSKGPVAPLQAGVGVNFQRACTLTKKNAVVV